MNINTRDLYNILKPKLEDLESARLAIIKKIAQLVKVIIIVCILIAIPVIYFSGFGWVVMIGIAGMFAFIIGKAQFTKKYKNDYKAHILKEMVSSLGSSYTYNPQGKIDESLLFKSHLFQKYEKVICEDLIEGSFTKYSFQQAEINLSSEGMRGQGSGPKIKFNGLFFVGKLSLSFPVKMWIYSKNPFNVFATGDLQKIDPDNEDFNSLFVVYAEESKADVDVLPKSMLDSLVNIQRELADDILNLSFIDNNVFISISSDKALFEPSLHVPVTDFEKFTADFKYLKFTTGFLEQLLTA